MDRNEGSLWTLGALVVLLLACCLPAIEQAEGPPPEEPRGLVRREPPTPQGTQLLHFNWEDANSVPVVERRGDSFVRDSKVRADRYSLSYDMDQERLLWAMDAYGIPGDWAEFTFEDEEDRLLKFEAAREKAALRGIRLTLEGNTVHLSADGEWIVGNSWVDLATLAKGLYDAAVTGGRRDQRELLGVVASFVQGLQYKLPPDQRTTPSGMTVSTCGVTMPLETLQNGTGDCDTKCFLLASVLANVEGWPVVFLEGENHMFIGVACPLRPGDRYVTVQGLDYVLIEVTYPWPIGAIPRSIEDGLQANRYQVIPLRAES